MARVMIAAGGTGGHVYPALAVACWLRDRGHAVYWMGGPDGLEQRVVPAAGFPVDTVAVRGLRGKGVGRLLQAPFMLSRALWQAGRILRRHRPQVILGMGGFVAGPGGWLARWLGIPLVIHEQNRVPGTTNRWLAPYARRVLEGFPRTFATTLKPCWTGNPLRREIAALPPKAGPAATPRLLVLGGSQGAEALNDTVPKALAGMSGRLAVWHQCGAGRQADVARRYREAGFAPVRVDDFIEDMAAAWRWADLAVCRAGAMTISELAAAGVAAVLIPFPHAIDDHQRRNAEYLVEQGGAVMLLQSQLTPATLRRTLEELIDDREKLRTMGMSASRAARLDATETVARICLEVADGA